MFCIQKVGLFRSHIALYTIVMLAVGQLSAQIDDTTLEFSQYIQLVKDQHPMMQQLRLLEEMSEGNQLLARGAFDPKIEGNYDFKNFEGKNYFSLLNGGLKIPTWYGVELKAGYDRTSGEYFDASDLTPSRGLWSAGISLPLAKGLVLDKRRAELRKADVFERSIKVEQQLLVNELFYEASEAYIQWQKDSAIRQVAIEGLTLARTRYEGTKSSFIGGDKAAIDTLEAFISVQTREQLLIEADQSLENSRLEIESYLWLEGEIPLELSQNTTPEVFDITFLNDRFQLQVLNQFEIVNNHPNIQQYALKLEELNIEKALQKEDLKPDLRIYYNPLVGSTNEDLFAELNVDNYKLEASLSYPLFLRKARGKLKMTDAKIGQAANDMLLKKRDIELQLDQYIQNVQMLVQSLDVQEQAVMNYRMMLEAENQKLRLGESSIFLVNSREQKYLDSRQKELKTTAKLLKYRLHYLFYTGRLVDQLL